MPSQRPLERLTRLAGLPAVVDAVAATREVCAPLRLHPVRRRRGLEAAAEARVRAAWADAALEGVRLPLERVRLLALGVAAPSDAAETTALGCLRAVARAAELIGAPGRAAPAPAAALAGVHLAAGVGLLPESELGRPRPDGGPELVRQLHDLGALLDAPPGLPAVLVAALVQAELLTLRPFRAGNGIVARAVCRALVVGRGLDVTELALWEWGLLDAPDASARALAGYPGGEPEALAEWVEVFATALVAGAGHGRAAADAVLAGRTDLG